MVDPSEADALADALADLLAQDEAALLLRVVEAKGSTPREQGAAMLVSRHAIFGTIGGGGLEWAAIDQAREMLAGTRPLSEWDAALGPTLGQCCGGRVRLSFTPATPATLATLRTEAVAAHAREPFVAIFGAGHVGRALAQALGPLPFRVALFDDRDEERARASHPSAPLGEPEAAVAALPQGAGVVIMTHSHTLDFRLGRAALERDDLAYVGMIGSATKRARFASWMTASGGDAARLARLSLPIGASETRDKRPAVIAALAATELIRRLLTGDVAPRPDWRDDRMGEADDSAGTRR